MAATTAAVTSSIISATSQHKRDYAEKIRRLYPSITRILALVKGSNLDAFGKVAYDGKGMITKKEAKRMSLNGLLTHQLILHMCLLVGVLLLSLWLTQLFWPSTMLS